MYHNTLRGDVIPWTLTIWLYIEKHNEKIQGIDVVATYTTFLVKIDRARKFNQVTDIKTLLDSQTVTGSLELRGPESARNHEASSSSLPHSPLLSSKTAF